MNHPVAAEQARRKPWQLCVAHHSGFAVPPTLITTFPHMARDFAARYRDLVVKSISGAHPSDPPMALPTSRVEPDADFAGVAAGPTLLQQHVPKRADIRLTCVGDELFAARKLSDPKEVDGRFTDNGDLWSPVRIPDRIVGAVRAYMSLAHLAYGAFDFAEESVTAPGGSSSATRAGSSASSSWRPASPSPRPSRPGWLVDPPLLGRGGPPRSA
ncbi:hypothetical protein SANTM175S_02523 [Streptomyces antimycoticus]